MYVTDVPVMDRITNPAARELSAALELFEDMTVDLYGAADDVTTVAYEAMECDDIECGQPHAKDMERYLGRLSDCIELALAAQEGIRKSLTLLNLTTL